MKVTQTLIAIAVASTLSGAVLAQTTTGTTTAPGTAAPVTAPAVRPAAAKATYELKAVRLSKLDGVDIYDASDKKIGEIEEVYVDRATGKVQQVVASVGGVLGVGDKKYMLKTSDLKVFSKSSDDSVPARITVGKAMDTMPMAEKVARDSPYIKADKLIGTDVVDATGKEVGEIEDVVVDLQTGEAQYALLEFDKAWSPADKLFAIKMTEFKPAEKKDKLRLDVKKESLEKMPGIGKKDLDKADLSNPEWVMKVTQGPKQDGMIKDPAMKDAPMKDAPMKDAPMKDPAMKDGEMKDAPKKSQ